ncbi:YigZ family protein [Pokkaliibacter sp. CJK22405]|uniref:YigZ family protein n=1 Tax=Pokkaliibacter sp. CJK22405 TaxID=3384615 RepID=UPI0039847C60
MADCYQVPAEAIEVETEIKKSLFITRLARINSREDFAQMLQQARTDHPKANHHCSAFLLGPPEDDTQQGSSDDGEPSGSAGRPMLTVLQHSGVGEVAAIVIRYFGGIKLGVGGLVRAYSQGVQEALAVLPTQEQWQTSEVRLQCDYSTHARLQSLLNNSITRIIDEQFSADVIVTLAIPRSEVENTKAELNQQLGPVMTWL